MLLAATENSWDDKAVGRTVAPFSMQNSVPVVCSAEGGAFKAAPLWWRSDIDGTPGHELRALAGKTVVLRFLSACCSGRIAADVFVSCLPSNKIVLLHLIILSMQQQKKPTISLWGALIPVIILVVFLSFNVTIYGDDALGGSNQFILLIGAAVAAVVGFRNKVSYDSMLDAIGSNLKSTTGAILILLFVGALAGTWLLSGIIPAMIYLFRIFKWK